MGLWGIDNNLPKITDWIQAIATLIAVPAAIITFVKLLRRDRNAENQINVLGQMARDQTNSLNEMKGMLKEFESQTKQFEYQTELMKESNEIFKEHVIILSESVRKDTEYNQRVIALEERKRKAEIKPRFMFSGGFSSGGHTHQLRLRNIGKLAYLKDIVESENQAVEFIKSFGTGQEVQQNQEIILNGRRKNESVNTNLADYQFDLVFSDADNNLYRQRVVRFGNGGSYKVENPEEFVEGERNVT